MSESRDQIDAAIIGYGYIAQLHHELLNKFQDITIKAIFSRSHKSKKIPKPINFYTDYEELFRKEQLDVAFICTPTHTHEPIALACAEQGIDIFLEKPMARTLEQCDNIIDSIKNNAVHLFVAHALRYWPTYGSIKHYLDNNPAIIGTLESFRGGRLGTFPWSPWFADQEKSGGVILDLSIHDIDYANWVLGEPISVSCKAKTIKRFHMEVIGESKSSITFRNGRTACCEAS